MTPIFYHPNQDVQYDFISVNKIPEFVRQSNRLPHLFKPYEIEDFYLAHDRGYVDRVFKGTTQNGFGNTDAQLNDSLRYSNGSFWAAVQHVLVYGGVACSASQGFHHASWDQGYGYCTFNGLAIAAAKVLRAHDIGRVVIIDGDGHEGDGTNEIIRHYAELQDRVSNITRPSLGRGIQSSWNVEMWEVFARSLIRYHKPGIIFYQAGADAWEKDPYGAGYLTLEGLAARDRGIFTAARGAGIPVVWNLAGGYADPMQDTVDIHVQTLKISDEVYDASMV